MIYLTLEELSDYYGKPFAGPGVAIFNEDTYENHSDQAYKYQFGVINGRCVYAIIVKKSGGQISLPEAASFRALNGKGTWTYMTHLLPDKDSAALEKIFGDKKVALGWSYIPSASDQFQHPLFCSHQAQRTQLVVWHPKWHVDLQVIASK